MRRAPASTSSWPPSLRRLTPNADIVTRLADLAVRFGANVQPGQIVGVGCEPGKEFLTRAITESAYRHGAKFVDVSWFDPWVKRARIEHAPDGTLDFVPSWYGERAIALGDQRCARIGMSGPVAPGLLDDLDPARAGQDRLPAIKENVTVLNGRLVNWTVIPCPTPAWAALVHPDLEPDAALAKLWDQIAHICRLDEEDPVAVWSARRDQLQQSAATLTEHAFDSLHYEAEGTDLTIGLIEGARWLGGSMVTVDGVVHMPNLPTEEVFTSPDPERVDGVVRSSKPLVLIDGTVVRDLVLRFEGGRVVSVEASAGADNFRTIIETVPDADRLGEVALVDRRGRIGALDTVFYDTLLDENAASHLAIGSGFPFLVPDELASRINRSNTHIDFMIGSDDMVVTGISAGGERVPALVRGDWQI